MKKGFRENLWNKILKEKPLNSLRAINKFSGQGKKKRNGAGEAMAGKIKMLTLS